MMYRLLLCLALIFSLASSAVAQTEEELKTMKTEKEEELAALQNQVKAVQGEIADIKEQLLVFPRWETGAFGILGANLNGFSDWLARGEPNSSAVGLTFSANAFANHFTQKIFWRNAGNLNVGFTKLREKDSDGNILKDTELKSPDVINFTSLFGYKLSEKLAISILGEYRSTFLENFNTGAGCGGTKEESSRVILSAFLVWTLNAKNPSRLREGLNLISSINQW